jgi:hypothetical protein
LNQSQERAGKKVGYSTNVIRIKLISLVFLGVQRTRVADINASRTGETVSIRARIYTSRSKSM